jgi:hypothetical protein
MLGVLHTAVCEGNLLKVKRLFLSNEFTVNSPDPLNGWYQQRFISVLYVKGGKGSLESLCHNDCYIQLITHWYIIPKATIVLCHQIPST